MPFFTPGYDIAPDISPLFQSAGDGRYDNTVLLLTGESEGEWDERRSGGICTLTEGEEGGDWTSMFLTASFDLTR